MLLTSSSSRQSRCVGNFAQEFPLGQLRVAEGHVAGDVLQQDAAPEDVLHRAHARHDVRERLFGVWQRQQIVHVLAGDARSSTDDRRPTPARRAKPAPSPVQILKIQRRGAADRQRHAVQRDRKALAERMRLYSGLPPGTR